MKIKVIDQQNLEIITCEGSCVNISENNFNGFKELGFYLQCLLCKHIIKATDKKDHMYSKLHMKRVSFSFKDPHCLRQIDNSWGHCALCNQNIENSDTHILCNENHESLLNIALIADSNSLNKFASNCFKIENKGLPDNDIKRTEILNIDTSIESDDNNKHQTLQPIKIQGKANNNNEIVKTDNVTDNVDGNLSKIKSEDTSCKKDDAEINQIIDIFLNKVDNISSEVLITNKTPKNKTSFEADNDKNNTRLRTSNIHANNYSSKILNTDSIPNDNENDLPENLSPDYCSENDNCISHKILNATIILDGDGDHDENNHNLLCMNNSPDDNLEFNVICEDETKSMESNDSVINDLSNVFNTDIKSNQELDYCNVCETNLSDIDINLHINNKIHIVNEKIKNLDVHYLMEVTNINELRCKVCLNIITNMSTAVTNHLENVNHITNYNNLLAENCIRSLSNGTFYCDLCELHLTKIDEMLHIEESLHKQNKLEFKTYGKKDIKTKEPDPLEYHYCDVCNMNIPNNKTSILIHNLGVDHIQNENRLKKNKLSQDTSTSFNIHRHMISKINHLYCLVCNIEILNNESIMNEHIQADDHLTQYSNILILNHIDDKNGKFNCKICAIDDLKNELIHCKSQGHIKALNSLKKVNYTNNVIPSSKESCLNISNNSNVENKNLPSHLLQKVHNSMELMCKVCQVYLPNKYENIVTHLRGSKHKRKYEDYKNESVETGMEFDMKYLHYHMKHETKNLHCIVCNEKVIVDEKAMCDHIKSNNHNTNYDNFIEKNQLHEEYGKFYCKACLDYVNFGHELMHCKSKSHMVKLISVSNDINIETIQNLNPSLNDVRNEIAIVRQMIGEVRSLMQNFFGISK